MRLTFDQRHYKAYIASPEWAAKRKEALEHHGRYCRGCGTQRHLQVHHRTYEQLGREPIDDLVVLCTVCHQGVHALTRTGRTLEEATAAVIDSRPVERVPLPQEPDEWYPKPSKRRLRGNRHGRGINK